MLVREDLAAELARTTRILAHAGALTSDARITTLTGEVVYLANRGVDSAQMTPYDACIVRLVDGDVLAGEAPDDIERYLAAHRSRTLAKSVARTLDGTVVTGLTLLACAKATLLRARPDATWEQAEGEAKASGALIGTEP